MTRLLYDCSVLSKAHVLMKFHWYTMLSCREMDFNAKLNHIVRTSVRMDKGNTICPFHIRRRGIKTMILVIWCLFTWKKLCYCHSSTLTLSKTVISDLLTFSLLETMLVVICYLFSSPDPKGHVSYCHHEMSVVSRPSFSFHILIFSSETSGSIWTKLGRNGPWVVLFRILSDDPARQPRWPPWLKIENSQKISLKNFFSEITWPIGTELCWDHPWVVPFHDCIWRPHSPTKLAAMHG